MSKIVIGVTMKALSPIHHGAFSMADTGTISQARSMDIINADGEVVSVPVISGNAIRGVMRRDVFGHLIEVGAVREKLLADGLVDEWQHLYAAIMNGGHLKGSQSKLDPKELRELRSLIPPLSVFGSAMYTSMLAGRAEVGIAYPVCKETVEVGICTVGIEEEASLVAGSDLLTEWSHTRHIDEKTDSEITGVTPMPTTLEVIRVGAELQMQVVVTSGSELEASVLLWALGRISTLGGKSSVGLGRVKVLHDGEIGDRSGKLFEEWIESADIGQLFYDLAVKITPKKKAKKAKKKAK